MGYHLPFFPLYASETLSDGRFQVWTLEERGAWVTLLCHNWNDGDVPASTTELARLLHADATTAHRIMSAIGDRFVPVPGKQGRMWSPRLEAERDKATTISRKRSEVGRKGAANRWHPPGNGNGMPLPSHEVASADVCQIQPQPQPPPQPQSPANQPKRQAGEVNGSALLLFRSTLAEHLGLPRAIEVGRDPETVPFFEAQIAALGEDMVLQDCVESAKRSTSGTPSSLSWFVGWLKRLPVPKEAAS